MDSFPLVLVQFPAIDSPGLSSQGRISLALSAAYAPDFSGLLDAIVNKVFVLVVYTSVVDPKYFELDPDPGRINF